MGVGLGVVLVLLEVLSNKETLLFGLSSYSLLGWADVGGSLVGCDEQPVQGEVVYWNWKI